MTAMLNNLRALKAARDRGELSPEAFAQAEARLHDAIEDAVLEDRRAPGRVDRRKPEAPPADSLAAPQDEPGLLETALLVTAALAGLTMFVAVLIGSLTLALTLLVTLIAAMSVRAVRMLDD